MRSSMKMKEKKATEKTALKKLLEAKKMANLGTFARGVSIIGVGCTPFMMTLDSPETAGLTEGELFGYAAIEAMKDAGVSPKDIEYYIHGEANPYGMSHYMTPNMQVSRWFGAHGTPSHHHSEACCTGFIALDQAANLVASGKYDMVLTGCVEMAGSAPDLGKPAHMRHELTNEEFMEMLSRVYDRAYSNPLEAAAFEVMDDTAAEYCRRYSLTDEQMDDTLNALAISCRRASARHPKALHRQEYKDLALECGFENVDDFLKSPFNPKVTEYLRVSGAEQRCEGAAAAIVCSTETARKITDRYIEILGSGACAMEASTPHLERKCTAEAARQVYGLTGVKPEEIGLFMCNDFFIPSELMAAEETGYLPRGEGWKYILDGRTAFDGDKPMNTNGGRTAFGHAYGASGLADVYEAVTQMRGEAGERQVKKIPQYAMLRGFGGGQNVTCAILKKPE